MSSTSSTTAEVIVVGGGIVGTATALEISRREPGSRVLILEKEPQLAAHQTGHNSGVIHSGIYYKPGSLKSRLCLAGAATTKEFCSEQDIPFEERGKLLVATEESELERLRNLERNAGTVGLEVHWLDETALKLEESAISGIAALLVPSSGIVDYAEMTRRMADRLADAGGRALLDCEVVDLSESSGSWTVATTRGEYSCDRVVVCGGV